MLQIDKGKKKKLIRLIFSMMLFFSGYIIIVYIDYRLAVAIFAVQWANNLSNSLNK